MREHGNMDLDFSVRCAVKVSAGDMEYDRLYYGLTLKDYIDIFEDGGAKQLLSSYAALGAGGRRPGTRGIEVNGSQKYFFTKHLGKDNHHFDVQGGRDLGVVGALYGEGRAGSAGEAEAPARSAGSGDQGDSKGEVT
jgi:hypothetical protein